MADYRELLRKAIDALPDNTGANRRAVYEKARSALVAQLRAIDPPLPAREITTHRLNLEDCIREVEHEATERLLGRFRAIEDAPLEPTPDVLPVEDEQREPDYLDAEAEERDFEAPQADAPDADEEPAPEPIDPEAGFWPKDDEPETGSSEADPYAVPPVVEVWHEDEAEERPAEPAEPDDAEDTFTDQASGWETESWAPAEEAPEETPSDTADEPRSFSAGSIEDIIASAEQAAAPWVPDTVILDEADEPAVVAPSVSPGAGDAPSGEHHFLTSAADAEPHPVPPLVDVHGRPLGAAQPTEAASETAMSSVHEVDLEPGLLSRPEVSDAQVAIDRAIAALDREARGETEAPDDSDAAPAEQASGREPDAGPEARGGGFSALTIFLVISVLLLGGGGLAGYFAWREGFIDLNAVFAQSGASTTDTAGDSAVADGGADEPVLSATNTTPEVPSTNGEVAGAAMPGETLPFTETETPAPTTTEPEASFEDRLPAEAQTPAEPDAQVPEDDGIALAAEGAQSLLLEEQSGGATGAVPYSGSVEWSRGTDELGHPTIIADASIPARNLDVEVLLRRNADANLPASHLMEVKFTVAESFVGGSIANLPGVLLKDAELVQGQPLTGASARIVGNSFLFALSSASDIDVQNNLNLLSSRSWIDLAMVYGTGRRAILTLEKGEDGAEIFEDVLGAWAALDDAAVPSEGEDAASAAGEDAV